MRQGKINELSNSTTEEPVVATSCEKSALESGIRPQSSEISLALKAEHSL